MNPVTIGNWLLVIAAVPAVGAALMYGIGVTWWRSRWGRHLVAYMGSVALVLLLGCLRLRIQDTPAFAWIRVGAFALVVCALWWRFFYVVEALREGSPDESQDGHQ